MNRLDWLQDRQKGLGGSDLGQLPLVVRAVGGDPRTDCTPFEGRGEWSVYAAKTASRADLALAEKAGEKDEWMQWGNWLEAPLLDWAAGKLGGVVAREGTVALQHRRAPLRGNPDGVVHAKGEALGVECKLADEWRPWDEVPLYYQLQCMAYMALTGCRFWYVAVAFTKPRIRRLYRVDRDRDLEESMLEAVRQWWDLRIVRGVAPDVDDSAACRAALEARHPRASGASFADFRIASAEEQGLAAELENMRQVREGLDSDVRRLENRLREAIGDAPGLRWTGGSVRWSRNRIRIRIQEIER